MKKVTTLLLLLLGIWGGLIALTSFYTAFT